MKFPLVFSRPAIRLFALALAILPGVLNLPAQTTNSIGSTTLSSSSALAIAAGNGTISAGTLALNAGSANPSICVSGAGTLVLGSTTNNGTTYPDINFCANDTANSTANWGCEIVTAINLGGLQRYIWGRTDHNGVGQYGVTEADCQFGGSISGSGGLTFIAQDAFTSGSSPMETPFCLNAANTFTGPMIIQRGSVYLGAAGAFPAGDALSFNVPSGNNGRFFLYGQSVTVSNLASTSAGNVVIADGNANPSGIAPATLTIIENSATTYSGTLADVNAEYGSASGSKTTTLSVVKNGTATLTLILLC
jgi:hypothetical protein